MKTIYKNSHFLVIALFGIGVVFSGYILFSLPTELEKVSGKIDLNAINEAGPVLNRAFLVIGLTLLLGVITLVQFLYYLNAVKKVEVLGSLDKSDDTREQEVEQKSDSEKARLSMQVKEILAVAKGAKDERAKYEKLLSKLCMKMEASQGIFYKVKNEKNRRSIEMLTSFAFILPESETVSYEFGEGLAGQVAKEGKKINISNIPEGYINIISGLGSASPNHLLIYPVKDGEKVVAVAEIASFKEISEEDEKLIAEVLKMDDVQAKATKPAASAQPKNPEESKDADKANKK
jgi:putative methionine-R-sulfoxide reductase with GAF domain